MLRGNCLARAKRAGNDFVSVAYIIYGDRILYNIYNICIYLLFNILYRLLLLCKYIVYYYYHSYIVVPPSPVRIAILSHPLILFCISAAHTESPTTILFMENILLYHIYYKYYNILYNIIYC